MSKEKAKSLLDVTSDRPIAEITAVLAEAEDYELDNFLKFDPEKVNNRHNVVGFDLEYASSNPDVAIDARIMEMDSQGRYITRAYDKESLHSRLTHAPVISTPLRESRALTAAEAAAIVAQSFRLREDMSMDDGGTSPYSGFTPLFIGPFYRQQYMYRMLEAKSKAFEAWVYNPIAHRIPKIITQFTLGKGVRAEFKDDEAQKWWDQFAQHNKIGTTSGGFTRAGNKLRVWSDMLTVDGELMFQFVEDGDMLRIKCLDSATILEVVTDPADIEKIFYYHQQFATPYNVYSSPGVPGTTYVIRQIPADQVFHHKINVFDGEKRGRSDFFSILGWLKRTKDLINANVLKAYFQACYTWDYTIKGSPLAVQQFAAKNKKRVPTPGSSYYHNENVVRELISPTSHAGSGVESDLMGLMNMISLGTGIPPAYLLGSFAGSRAAALTETEPSSKFFFERQSIWDEILHEFSDRLFKWLRDKKGVQVKNTEVEFSFPQINPMDKTALVNVMERLKTNKWYSNKRCMATIASEFCATSYDPDRELDEIVKETKEEIQRELEESKQRSLAESQLSVWQSYFSQQSAEEQEAFGGGGAAAAGQDVAGQQQTAAAAQAKAGANSGGMSEKDRASVARGGR